jgi:hypothetical protein
MVDIDTVQTESVLVAILSSKWLISSIVLVAVLVVMYLLGRKSVHTELVIPADSKEVWSVLMDVPAYDEWNPVLIPVEGTFAEGEQLKYHMTQPDGKHTEVQATVRELIEEKKLNQYGGIPGILTFDHTWLLEPVEGGTRVTQHEEYRGIGVLFWNPSWFESAYQRANEALRDRVVHLQSNGRE